MPKMVISTDGVVIKEIELVKDRTTLGRRPYNDVVIENLAISGEHAVFRRQGDEVLVEDLNSTNGTYVNGKAIQAAVAVGEDDAIELGKYRIRVLPSAAEQAPATQATAPASAPPARIRVVSGPAAGREMVLVKAVTRVGKPGVAVATIEASGGRYTFALVDGDAPPTINGVPVGRAPVSLKHDDLIDIAGTQMRFDMGEAAALAAA